MPNNFSKTIIVDSDTIFALYNPNDPLYAKTLKTFKELIDQDYQLIYPTPVIFEVVSLFQRVLPSPVITAKIIEMIQNDQLIIQTIDLDLLKETAFLFNPAGSKKNTLIDCSVVITAKKLNAAGVFSYDNFYIKQGLKLVEELLGVYTKPTYE